MEKFRIKLTGDEASVLLSTLYTIDSNFTIQNFNEIIIKDLLGQIIKRIPNIMIGGRLSLSPAEAVVLYKCLQNVYNNQVDYYKGYFLEMFCRNLHKYLTDLL